MSIRRHALVLLALALTALVALPAAGIAARRSFKSVHKATGTGQLSFPTPDGGSCRTGVERFTAQD